MKVDIKSATIQLHTKGRISMSNTCLFVHVLKNHHILFSRLLESENGKGWDGEGGQNMIFKHTHLKTHPHLHTLLKVLTLQLA